MTMKNARSADGYLRIANVRENFRRGTSVSRLSLVKDYSKGEQNV